MKKIRIKLNSHEIMIHDDFIKSGKGYLFIILETGVTVLLDPERIEFKSSDSKTSFLINYIKGAELYDSLTFY